MLWTLPNQLTVGRLGLACVLFVLVAWELWLAALSVFVHVPTPSCREVTDRVRHPDPQHRVRCGHRDELTHPDRIVCHQAARDLVLSILGDRPSASHQAIANTISDGVQVNDVTFNTAFPYLAYPHSGSSATPH